MIQDFFETHPLYRKTCDGFASHSAPLAHSRCEGSRDLGGSTADGAPIGRGASSASSPVDMQSPPVVPPGSPDR
eukprot:2625807-Alexandrium_andersonii.AAC.1